MPTIEPNPIVAYNTSTMTNTMERNMDASMMPKRGLAFIKSMKPNRYLVLMFQSRFILVNTHQGSLNSASSGRVLRNIRLMELKKAKLE